ncbi:MAG TPA: hypothetical protein VES67_09080 [Vicinamibacterales bacterium]|nr:hypothetical protein [Vicinamibacterales bacterium]
MSTHIAGICLTLFVGSMAPAAQQQTPPPAQEKPAEAKAPASIAGKWNMTVDTQQGSMPVTLVMKLDGKKVTGTVTSQQGETPLEGEFAENKLTFWIKFQGGGGEMNITFNATHKKEDDTLSGTWDFGQGAMNWKAERAKG